MPVAQAFARHFEIVAHIWMKDKRQSHGTRRNDVVGEIRNSVTQVAVFVGQKAWLLFRDRSDVGKLASFLGEGIAILSSCSCSMASMAANLVTLSTNCFTRSP